MYLGAFGVPSPAEEIALVSLEDALEKVRAAVKKAQGVKTQLGFKFSS